MPQDRYQIIRKIGEEQIGSVFLASDLKENRYVFFHRIDRSGKVLDIDMGKYLDRARRIASLQSPHILNVLDVGEREEALFVVIELCEGATLRQKIRERPLSYAESLRLSLELGQALREGHNNGIIHGGLNPDGVLIDAAGRLKLPFIGHPWWFDRVAQIKTASEKVYSEEAYSAPECLQGERPDRQADIYAAGVIMHELFHGSIPARTFFDHSAARDASPAPSQEFDRILLRAAAKDRSERYSDAGTMIEDLLFLRTSETVAQKKVIFPSLPDFTWRDWIPWKLVMILIAFLFLLFLAFFFYSSLDA